MLNLDLMILGDGFFSYTTTSSSHIYVVPESAWKMKKPHASTGEMGSSYSCHGTLFARVILEFHSSGASYHRISSGVKIFASFLALSAQPRN